MSTWGIHRLQDMIAPSGNAASVDGEKWYRAVPLPYHGSPFERLRAAWSVFNGKSYAVQWPDIGELERALARK